MSKKRILIYGAFQDGTRPSIYSTDVCFGDRLIYSTMKRYLENLPVDIDFVLPDDRERMLSLRNCDYLIIGGGGLLHPNMLQYDNIHDCKAIKAVFDIGINWDYSTPSKTINEIKTNASFMKDIQFFTVRDFQTKEFLGIDHIRVYPDISFLNWIGALPSGKEKAYIAASPAERANADERLIYFHRLNESPESEKIVSFEQLKKFGNLRGVAYHGMLLSFALNATYDMHLTNVKHDAFISSYSNKLDIKVLGNNHIIVKCNDPEYFFNRAKESIDSLIQFVKLQL